MPSIRFRNCCFTWNNFPEDAEDILRDLPFKYCVYQEELGENGTPHLQGYFELEKQTAKGKVQKMIHGWHVEKRMGSQDQAIAYCTKEETRAGDIIEWGEKAKQGQRTDIEGMYEMIRLGKRERDIAEAMPAVHCKYTKGHDRYRSLVEYDSSKEFRLVTVDVLWGKAGCGKTKKACELADGDWYILNSPGSNGMLWFDGYQGEKTLVIDDFYGWIKYHELLRILDGHQYRCSVKGGFRWAFWEHVIVTSNKPPEDWYPSLGMTPALQRRLDDVQHLE